MKGSQITRAQFAAAIFTGMLSPMMGMLPRAAVRLAGKGAWLSAVPAFFGLLLLSALMNALRRGMPPGEGMANLILRVFGPAAGRVVLLLYGAWFLFYTGFVLRAGAERLTAAVYQESGTTPFILVMLALCAVTSLGTLRAAARTAVLIRSVLLAVLGAVALFALWNLSARNLFPLSPSDLPGIAMGSLPILDVGGAAALFSFLSACAEPPERSFRWVLPSLVLFTLISMLLCLETVGTFGAGLTVRLSHPFFTMIRDVSVFHIAQRIEAVVIALWVFADYILCSMLLRCAHEALRTLFGLPRPEGTPFFSLRRGRWLLLPEFGAAFAAALLTARSASALVPWSERYVPMLLCAFSFGGFGLLWLVGRLRKML
ncbi:MAG: GerAB/ArcD/ProY family transporter [Oscillospiraceae bacterium]|nr:GerAB/ArcD/ProY family transporter [Oscillospiraceae bacterium]